MNTLQKRIRSLKEAEQRKAPKSELVALVESVYQAAIDQPENGRTKKAA